MWNQRLSSREWVDCTGHVTRLRRAVYLKVVNKKQKVYPREVVEKEGWIATIVKCYITMKWAAFSHITHLEKAYASVFWKSISFLPSWMS